MRLYWSKVATALFAPDASAGPHSTEVGLSKFSYEAKKNNLFSIIGPPIVAA